MNNSETVTRKSIAQAAGVYNVTVYRVLNHQLNGATFTRTRILHISKELG